MQYGCLQAGEAELETRPVEHRTREVERAGLSAFRQLRELWTSRVRQAEQLRGLVEGLAGGIIARLSEHLVEPDTADFDQHRVSTGHQQCDVGERGRIRFKKRSEQMSFEMVDAHRGHAPRVRETSCERRPGEQGADQTRTCRVGHPEKLSWVCAGAVKNAANQGQQATDVVPGGQFRHYAPVHPVQIDLAE